ncbi:MAG: hypothetical protein HC892_09100 [Saprospiraceae bacterium]|nr:hypothetical protein [Saprospiraceae bacterium]
MIQAAILVAQKILVQKSGNFIPDHQPPNALVPDGTPQYLFPHCKNCSSSQGGTISALKKKGELD